MAARFYHRGRFDSFGGAGMAESAGLSAHLQGWIVLRTACGLYKLQRMPQRSGFRYVAVPAVLFVAAFVFMQGRPWTAMRVAGIALMVPGFVLWGIAHVQLGDSFSIRAEARQLVTHGLYSRFRSPIYLFGGIGIAGFVLAIERPILLLAFLVLIPMQIVRSRREARVLEEKFGDEYREYARHTWF
jgi:protein-S-isoprenylcysteine O-methyltransferase Ste14